MTEPEPLDLLDTDYANLITTDYDPNLERLMRAAGESPTDAVLLTRLVGLVQKLLSRGTHPEAAETRDEPGPVCPEDESLKV